VIFANLILHTGNHFTAEVALLSKQPVLDHDLDFGPAVFFGMKVRQLIKISATNIFICCISCIGQSVAIASAVV